MKVLGTTKIYAVVGDPIQQVQSTDLYNQLFLQLGIDAICIPLQFAAADAATAIAGLRTFKNLAGIIATIPHKTTLLNASDAAMPRAQMIGAANAVRAELDGRWVCDAFDGVGYVEGLNSAGWNPRGKAVQLIGLGGAGASMAFALAEAGVARLRVYDIDGAKIDRIVTGLAQHFPALRAETGPVDLSTVDIVSNATPLGMSAGDDLPLDPALLNPRLLVTDMIMKPPETPLLRAAKTRGCAVQNGHAALRGQAQAVMRFFGYAVSEGLES